jgi:phosphate starvation-inducible PhoH-like protein
MTILDEAQNTTEEQMRMFLTRMGQGSRAIITGDITQTDLPRSQRSGLMHAIEVLEGIPEIKFNYFKSQDVVRHPLVQKIVEAYQASDRKQPRSGSNEN